MVIIINLCNIYDLIISELIIIALITLNAKSIIMHMNTMTQDLHVNAMGRKPWQNN